MNYLLMLTSCFDTWVELKLTLKIISIPIMPIIIVFVVFVILGQILLDGLAFLFSKFDRFLIDWQYKYYDLEEKNRLELENKIKVIRTEEDYQEALKFIEVLMDKDPDPESENGKKISILSNNISDYESKKYNTKSKKGESNGSRKENESK